MPIPTKNLLTPVYALNSELHYTSIIISCCCSQIVFSFIEDVASYILKKMNTG